MSKIKIGVTGTGSLIGQVIIKSIQASFLKEEVVLIGFDYVPGTIGSYWVNENFLLPDFLKPEISHELWVDKLIEILKKEEIRILLIGIDFELPLFTKFKEVIESKTKCKIVVSNPSVVDIANDKYLTYQFLKEKNFPCPATWLPEQLKDQRLTFPCVLKPRIGAGSKGIAFIKSKEELFRRLPDCPDGIVQEIIGDSSREYTCGVIVLEGHVKEIIALRRELKKGETMTAYFQRDIPPVICEYVQGVASSLKPFGPCNFQLRVDHDNVPKIFEINARFSGTTYMRALFGFKEVEYILCHLLGYQIKGFTLKEGIAKRYFEEKLIETR